MKIPGDVVTFHFALCFQVPKIVHQINEIVPVTYQKSLQVAESTIFDYH